MALKADRRAELATMSLPSEAEMRERIRSFQLRSGLGIAEFADLIGYAATSVGLFLSGKYDENHPKAENTLAIRAAAKQFMDLHDLSANIRLNGTHYETDSFLQVKAAAMIALRRGAAYIVDGPPGTEKTESFRRIEREIRDGQLGRVIYVYARINHSPQSFLMECCTAASIPNRGSIDALLRKLRFFLAKGRTLLMIDEAQHLDHAGLEVLRQLLDLPPYFGVLLGGSHDLTQRLSHWQMEQWRSRVRKTLYLNGPTRAECRTILRAELGADMTDEECDETIAACRSTAQRMTTVKGKPTAQTFQYTSARSLFGAIEQAHEALTGAATPREQGDAR